MSTIDSNALECLAAIVEEGGFERAALRLSITQSAVSQRLRALEVQIGAVLLVRSRPVRATPAGRLLLKHALQMRLLRTDLERDLQDLTPGALANSPDAQRVAIAINADSIATWAVDALGPLARMGLGLEIITDDQDFTIEWLREGQVLGCVTTVKQALRSCRLVPLGAMRYVAVAQADYAAEHCPNGLSPHNFRSLPFVAFNRKDDLQSEFVGRVLNLRQPTLSQLYVPSSEGQVQAVLNGWGVSVLPQLQVRQHIKEGRLVDIAPGQALPVELYWHCWNLDSAVLDALSKALTKAAAVALG